MNSSVNLCVFSVSSVLKKRLDFCEQLKQRNRLHFVRATMKTPLFLVSATLLALGAGVQAQQNGNQNSGNANSATLPLPDGVESVISIDASNTLLVQTDRDGKRELGAIIVRHIYSGGIARLFGGGSIPTSQFVSPGVFGGGNNGGGNNGGNGFQGNNANNQNGNNQNGGFGGGFQGGANGGGGFGGGNNFGAFQMRRFGRGRN